MSVLFCPLEEGLFEVEALAESGVVEEDDGDELSVSESFRKSEFCNP